MCLCGLHDISKTDAARITNLNTEMFQDESWISIYFVVKRSKVKVTGHKNVADVGPHSFECWLFSGLAGIIRLEVRY